MKTNAIRAAMMLFVLTAFSFTACKKDKDTLQEQLVGNWKSISMKINGIDYSSLIKMDIILKADGTGTQTVQIDDPETGEQVTETSGGNWVVNENKKEVTFTSNDSPGEAQVWKIKAVEDDSFSMTATDDELLLEIEFERK